MLEDNIFGGSRSGHSTCMRKIFDESAQPFTLRIHTEMTMSVAKCDQCINTHVRQGQR